MLLYSDFIAIIAFIDLYDSYILNVDCIYVYLHTLLYAKD